MRNIRRSGTRAGILQRCKFCAAAMLVLMIPAAYRPSTAATAVSLDSVVARVKGDLAVRRGASVEDIRTLSAKAVVWRDTSLGCGKPTESHAQIDIEGFRIILEHQSQRFDYRARSDGQFVLCPAALSIR